MNTGQPHTAAPRAGLRVAGLAMVLLLGWPSPAPLAAAPWVPDRGDGTYQNPVLHADYSDPDLIRVGDDDWLTSSFQATVDRWVGAKLGIFAVTAADARAEAVTPISTGSASRCEPHIPFSSSITGPSAGRRFAVPGLPFLSINPNSP